MNHRHIRRLFAAFGLLAALAAYILWGNTAITVTEITVTDNKIPPEFSGFRIAQISDLHNDEFGKDNVRLLKRLAESQPDLIVLTGDIIDSYDTHVAVSAAFVEEAARIAPTYYVTGNHEARVREAYEALKSAMLAAGATVLENELAEVEYGGASITLMGLHDPNFTSVEDNLALLAPQAEGYTVLLAHRPELVGYYAGAGVDLVFSGHAHGGQFRFPLFGGLIAPGQGLFPVYDAGLYTVGDTRMIVSRGLGNSAFPFRFNNRPELVIAQLKAE